MRRALPPLVAAGLSTFAAARAAPADTIESMREAPLRIERARLDARLDGGTLHATIRYDVVNPGTLPDAATVRIDLPLGSVVTGLRHHVGERWIDARLRAAEAASERFLAYEEAPFVAARGAALLTHDGYQAQLSLSYVPGRGRVPVAYDVVTPACFTHGRWIAPVSLTDPVPRVHVTGGRIETEDVLERALGEPIDQACARFELTEHHTGYDRYLVFDGRDRGVEGTVASVDAAGTIVSELAVVVGAKLEAAPRGAAVVFVLDASRSMGDDGVAEQLAVIRGYLAHVPDARFDVIVFRRHATRLFGELVPAASAEARLAALPPGALAPGNGSSLELGLALAADVLARAAGPRRLLAFTDDRTRAALDDTHLLAALAPLPADAIVHLAIPRTGAAFELGRDFDHRFVEVATRWGGIVAYVDVGAGVGGDPAPLVELVRPIRIEAVTLDVGAEVHEELDAIEEGTGLRRLFTGTAAPVLRGWIWGRRWSPAVVTSRTASARVARLALGALAGGLDDPAVAALAGLGTVATRLTSFLGEDPAWKPGGLPEEDALGMSGGSFSTSSMCGWPSGMIGRYGTIGVGSGTGTGRELDPDPELSPLLAARVAACAAPLGAGAWATTVTIETTGIEVVDVVVATDAAAIAAAPRARFEACVLEAAWDLELDPRFARYTRTFVATFTR